MEAIRTVQIVTNGEVHLQLPRQFWGREVEVIVLPAPVPAPQSPVDKKGLRGCLKSYAKPGLIEQEQDAWLATVVDKHEPC